MATRMTIDTAGNVGIGTTAPNASLQVYGGVMARGGAPGTNGANNNGYAFAGNSGDNDSGMYSLTNDNLSFYTTALERLRIDGSGNVGIGTTAPVSTVEIYTNASGALGSILTLTNGTAASGSASAIDFRGSNWTQPIGARIMALDNSWSDDLVFYNKVPGATGNALSETMRIAAGGKVGIGTTNPGYPLEVASTVSNSYSNYGYLSPSGAGTNLSSGATSISIRATGRILAPEFGAISDRRAKEEITSINENDALRFLDAARPVHFRWKTGDGIYNYGFIAQEIDKIGFRELVSITSDQDTEETVDTDGYVSPAGTKLNISYNQIVAMLTKAVQAIHNGTKQLIVRVTGLEDRIDQLAIENEKLKATTESFKSENAALKAKAEAMEEVLCSKFPDSRICNK